MKKILIATYYFPPCNIISAQRAKSFADNFKKYGLHPIVVTRHWNGDENSTAGYESENLKPPAVTEFESYTLIQLPYSARLNEFYHRPLMKSNVGKSLLYAGLYALGTVNPKCDALECFSDYLLEYLNKNPVDYIFATAFPMNAIKLGSFLARKFNKPFIADFRDLWDNSLLSKNYQPSSANRLQNFFYEFYLRKWLKEAKLVTAVSRPLFDEIQRIAPHTKQLLVTNGYEEELFAEAREQFTPPSDKFVFSVIGTLEPKLDLSVMLEGLKLFWADKNPSEIRLNFIGAAAFPEIKGLIERNLPGKFTTVTARLPRAEAIRRTCESHVLFHAGWRGFRGMASGKIYEYLGARRNILIAPGDKDVMEKIITETRAGKSADTPEEFAAILNEWFAEWKANGKIAYHGLPEKIQNYSRENQAAKLAREILALE